MEAWRLQLLTGHLNTTSNVRSVQKEQNDSADLCRICFTSQVQSDDSEKAESDE